jgi:DNA ligase-1
MSITKVLACRGNEVLYLVRTLIRNLRVGANWRSVMPALGRAAAFFRGSGPISEGHDPRKSKAITPDKSALSRAAATVVDVYQCCPNISRLCQALLDVGVWRLEEACGIELGVPLRPMLAKITEGFDDCVQQIVGATVLSEFKYDGQRSQIHVSEDGQVWLSSRISTGKCWNSFCCKFRNHRGL